MKRFRLSPEAQGDLTDIKDYLVDAGGARLARYVLGEIRAKLGFLAENPLAGHSRADLTDEPVRFWPVFSYLIVYDPAKIPLDVVRILHGSRDVGTLLKLSPNEH